MIRVLTKVRIAVAFYPPFISISVTSVGRAEYLTAIILLHLIGGCTFKVSFIHIIYVYLHIFFANAR